ncbi:MAG: cytochrome d ubiquinol oxidase subunit II [Planctomycetota bacterium]|nr:MAG: cytochrome d ubiquinol oxidase subunit II [Planctomycetota bacterium]
METLWFWIVASALALYVVFDGFDIGAGIAWPFIRRDDADGDRILQSIGPFWDGNEVWLLAAGGLLYLAFPELYATSMSGFFLPITLVLWLLILRGIGLEFRHQLQVPAWKGFWGFTFVGASYGLALAFGAALGNVVRGVPFNAEGRFFLPFLATGEAQHGILDPYPLLVAVTALVVLGRHGAIWIGAKCHGALRERARRLALQSTWPLLVLFLGLTLASFWIQPNLPARFTDSPLGAAFPAATLASLFLSMQALRRENEVQAFFASSTMLVGLLGSAAFGVYPYVLPGIEAGTGLKVADTITAAYGLETALIWAVPGLLLVGIYFWILHRRFAGRIEN